MKPTNCPADGKCSLSIQYKKSLNLIEDSWANTYPEIVNGNKVVFTFEYKRNEIPNTADGHYIEQILFELNPENINLELKDQELENVNMLFARFCYCKGQTGYYKVTDGHLKIKKLKNEKYYLSLNFSQDYVPQIMTFIGEIFELKKSP